MEVEKISDKQIDKKATVTHEGRIVSSYDNNRYNIRLNYGTFLKNISGISGLSVGDYVIISKQGSIWNIIQKTYDIGGDTKVVSV